jgi:hypothetical protein
MKRSGGHRRSKMPERNIKRQRRGKGNREVNAPISLSKRPLYNKISGVTDGAVFVLTRKS